MNGFDDLDRQLRATFMATAPKREPDGLFESVMSRTATLGQRHSLIVRTRELVELPTVRWPAFRGALVALGTIVLLLLAMGAALIIGSRPATPTTVGCAPVAPETLRADYSVVIQDTTGLVTACRLGRGVTTWSSFGEGDIEISDPVGSGGRLRALWSIHGCDSDAVVGFAQRSQTFTLTVDAYQEGTCVPGGDGMVTIDLEFGQRIAATEVRASIRRTRRVPGDSLAPMPALATPACAGFADEAALSGTPQSGDAGSTWTSAPPPQDLTQVRPGALAAVTHDLPEWPLAIVRLNPSTGDPCRLVGLSADRTVFALDWSPRGDALAISALDPSGTGELLVWSATGITRAWTGTEAPRVSWSPDGSMIAVVTNAGAAIVYSINSLTEELDQPANLAVWSPDGTRLALWHRSEPADAIASGTIAIATVADGVTTVLESGAPLGLPISWLDDQTLLAYESSGGVLNAIPIDDPNGMRPWPGAGPQFSMARLGGSFAFSPDATLAAFTVDEATLVVGDSRTGGSSEVADVREFDRGGTTAVLQGLAWSPDSRSIAFSVGDSGSGMKHGIWVVDNDGRNLRLLTDRPFSLLDRRDFGDGPGGGSWQPSWQEGEVEP